MSGAVVSWTKFSDLLLDWLYPRRCPLCDGLEDLSPCPACRTEFEASGMAAPRRPLEFEAVLFRYHGRAAQAVRRLKYDRCTSLVPFMAEEVAKAVVHYGLDPDVFVPVPIHSSRRRERGFNQSELLAGALPREKVRPELLRRIRATRPQVGLRAEERLQNLRGAFEARGVEGLSILLIDDVLTSGGTVTECARTLLNAGAREVGFLGFAGESL